MNVVPVSDMFRDTLPLCMQNHLINPRTCSFLQSPDAANNPDAEVVTVLSCLQGRFPKRRKINKVKVMARFSAALVSNESTESADDVECISALTDSDEGV